MYAFVLSFRGICRVLCDTSFWTKKQGFPGAKYQRLNTIHLFQVSRREMHQTHQKDLGHNMNMNIPYNFYLSRIIWFFFEEVKLTMLTLMPLSSTTPNTSVASNSGYGIISGALWLEWKKKGINNGLLIRKHKLCV